MLVKQSSSCSNHVSLFFVLGMATDGSRREQLMAARLCFSNILS